MKRCSLRLKKANIPDRFFSKKQLKMGIKVEQEHTSNKKIAKAIAKAHLKEFPFYYTALAQMERNLKQKIFKQRGHIKNKRKRR